MDVAPDSLGNATGLSTSNRWLVVSPNEKFHFAAMDELLRSTEL